MGGPGRLSRYGTQTTKSGRPGLRLQISVAHRLVLPDPRRGKMDPFLRVPSHGAIICRAAEPLFLLKASDYTIIPDPFFGVRALRRLPLRAECRITENWENSEGQ